MPVITKHLKILIFKKPVLFYAILYPIRKMLFAS